MHPHKIIVILLAFVFSFGTTKADTNSDAMMFVFESVCLASHGSKEYITQWANEKQLQEVIGEDARKVFSGIRSNSKAWNIKAWWFKTEQAVVILEIYPAGGDACTVYSSTSDPIAVHQYIDALALRLKDKWPRTETVAEATKSGTFGNVRGRFIAFGTSEKPGKLYINVVTEEKAGGLDYPYQAMIAAMFSRK